MNDERKCTEDEAGFTLIELVAVLIVVGILAVVVNVGINTRASLIAESDMMRANLRYAQSMAVANNIYEWSISFNGQSYNLRRDGQPSPIPWPGERSASHVLPADVNLVQGGGVLTFNSWGVPAADYTVVLTDGIRSEQVDVLGGTGLIP